MLATACEWLRANVPNVTLVISTLEATPEQAKIYGLTFLKEEVRHVGTDTRSFKLSWGYPRLYKVLKKIKGGKSVKGEVSIQDVNAILDLSGLAYSDKWGSAPMENLKYLSGWCKSKGKKYILMPQAFGPFTSAEARENMSDALGNVDMAFARDDSSFAALQDVAGGNEDKIGQCSDMTHLVTGQPSPNAGMPEQKFFVIVPNARMLDKAGGEWKAQYSGMLNSIAVETLNRSSLDLMIMVHSTTAGADSKLAGKLHDELKSEYGSRVSLFTHEDPLFLKYILKNSSFVVGSRFHALVSALSSGTPAIGTSWQHKYRHLFDEYDCAEFLIEKPDQDFLPLLSRLIDEAGNARQKERITKVGSSIKESVADKFSNIIAPLINSSN